MQAKLALWSLLLMKISWDTQSIHFIMLIVHNVFIILLDVLLLRTLNLFSSKLSSKFFLLPLKMLALSSKVLVMILGVVNCRTLSKKFLPKEQEAVSSSPIKN